MADLLQFPQAFVRRSARRMADLRPPLPERRLRRWPGAVRLAIICGGTGLGWVGVVWLIGQALH